MRRNFVFMFAVLLLAALLIAVKHRLRHPETAAQVSDPTVILVADLREANEPNDNCAEIIHIVREAEKAGVRVSEITPDSDSATLKQHRIVVAPTVLILGKDGHEISRFEGEQSATVQAIRLRLQQLRSRQ